MDLGSLLSGGWGKIMAVLGMLLAMLAVLGFGRKSGQDNERRKQMEAENKAQSEALRTGADAVKAVGDAAAKAEKAQAEALERFHAKRDLAKGKRRMGGGGFKLPLLLLAGSLLALSLAGCAVDRTVVQYPPIPDQVVYGQGQEFPAWEFWWPSDEELAEVLAMEPEALEAWLSEYFRMVEDNALVAGGNEAIARGLLEAFAGQVRAYMDFKAEYVRRGQGAK